MLLQQVTLTFYNNKLISNERVVQGFQAMACFHSQVPFHICLPQACVVCPEIFTDSSPDFGIAALKQVRAMYIRQCHLCSYGSAVQMSVPN